MLLDHSVFQRMEGNDDQPPAGRQPLDDVAEELLQGIELPVDGNAEGLESPCGLESAVLGTTI
jgi:hypothetical protein